MYLTSRMAGGSTIHIPERAKWEDDLGPFSRTSYYILYVSMAISTNPKPTIYRSLYENTGFGRLESKYKITSIDFYNIFIFSRCWLQIIMIYHIIYILPFVLFKFLATYDRISELQVSGNYICLIWD